MTRLQLPVLVSLFFAGVPLVGAPLAASAQDAENGAAIFAHYCATCHGLDATGQGPMAPVLIVQPTDLTRLAETNGGQFPMTRVVMRIDGREPLVSHGSPMPVYGPLFDEEANATLKADSGQPIMTSKPAADLVAYLQMLQTVQPTQ